MSAIPTNLTDQIDASILMRQALHKGSTMPPSLLPRSNSTSALIQRLSLPQRASNMIKPPVRHIADAYTSLGLNPELPQIMHIDLNAAFASAMMQLWSELRDLPVCVTNIMSKECCMIAVSYNAKKRGIKTGMRYSEAKALCPNIVVLETRSAIFTHMYRELVKIMRDYSPKIKMKSIDEGVIDFHDLGSTLRGRNLVQIGYEIKQRVYEMLGDNMHVNIGIGPNEFYAKMAAGWHKPNGLDILSAADITGFLKGLNLQDLTGIADGFGNRLWAAGIKSPIEFLEATPRFLRKQVFKSICGLDWYFRLRGYEVDDREFKKQRFGKEKVLSKPSKDPAYIQSFFHYLVEISALKMREAGYNARGFCVRVQYVTYEVWYDKLTVKTPCTDTETIWHYAERLLRNRPTENKVRHIEFFVYDVAPESHLQLSFFEDLNKRKSLTEACDGLRKRYGINTVIMLDSLVGRLNIKPKIPFGSTEFFNLLIEEVE